MKTIKFNQNIKNLHSILKFIYYVLIVIAILGIISYIAFPFLPDSAISFEQGIRGWVYYVNVPLIGSVSTSLTGDIPNNILQFVSIEKINVSAAIIINSLISDTLFFIILILGLKKLLNLTAAMLKNETPFQLKYIKSLRHFSYIILLYSTLSNTVLSLLNSLFVVNFFYFTFDFKWSGVLFGIVGYIFSDITEYGLFLQDEYDSTL